MEIQFDTFRGHVRIDLTTPEGREGTSASGLETDDPENTAVTYGGLYVQVVFKDLGLEVTMDTYEGDWHNSKWAREQASSAVAGKLTPEYLHKLMVAATERGEKRGVWKAQEAVKRAIGL